MIARLLLLLGLASLVVVAVRRAWREIEVDEDTDPEALLRRVRKGGL